ncbi:hypothetical protein EKO04_010590 [Ascochyta lentis]|uniref:Uncharacterized protein n=1 Tax=Ascochyta lentis TaxID=205686 RepID=A0A8H7IUC7_9PLEO|nr:hypothetical protein EKO04_010590 [Ascochyta lentis]
MATESCDNPENFKVAQQREKLKILSSRSIITDITDDQAKCLANQKAARKLFDNFLSAYRRHARFRRRRVDAEDEEELSSSSQSSDVFRFLDLPAEIRNTVYAIYCKEDRVRRHKREERYRKCRNPGRGSRIPYPCRALEQEFQNLAIVIGAHIRKKIVQPEKILDSGIGQYEEYEVQHQYKRKCAYEHEYHSDMTVVSVNARGNLCENLPPLSLASRQLLSETWASVFPAGSHRFRYQVTVRNFSVLPFFRLAQLFQRQRIQIHGDMINIELEDEAHDNRWYKRVNHNWLEDALISDEEVDEENDKERNISRYAMKFSRLTWLIQLHWLQGVPLWNCFTNARRDWNKKDLDKITLGAWLYSVRQIVALHRINASKWQDLSTQLLHRRDIIHGNEFPWPLSDASMVAETIGVFSEALEYRLGRAGNYTRGRYGDAGAEYKPHRVKKSEDPHRTRRFVSRGQTATEQEHAVIHIVNLYRVKVDEALRLELGNLYEEWKLAEDEKKIPEDVIF